MIDMQLANEIIAITRQVAKQEILPRFRNLGAEQIETKSRKDDLVTVADKATEAALTSAFRTFLPDVLIVGEESIAADPNLHSAMASADRVMIIDPIDGTYNFAFGLPLFGVILAYVEQGVTTWGMIYDPVMDDWAIAARGQGAFLENADGVRRMLSLDQSPVAEIGALSGLIHSNLFYGDERRRLFHLMPDFARTGVLRCSAHEYRSLAQGGVDFTLSPMLNAWDHAAGCLIAEEAGGVARLLTGEPYRVSQSKGRLLVARNAQVWELLAQTFRKIDLGVQAS